MWWWVGESKKEETGKSKNRNFRQIFQRGGRAAVRVEKIRVRINTAGLATLSSRVTGAAVNCSLNVRDPGDPGLVRPGTTRHSHKLERHPAREWRVRPPEPEQQDIASYTGRWLPLVVATGGLNMRETVYGKSTITAAMLWRSDTLPQPGPPATTILAELGETGWA